jgi:photosystem II stability/assembly factor-like uncharacterized protein
MAKSLANDEILARLRRVRPSVPANQFQAGTPQAVDLLERILAIDTVAAGTAEAGSPTPSGAAYPHHRAHRRTRRVLAGVAVLLLAAVGTAFVVTNQHHTHPGQPASSWTLTGYLSKLAWRVQPTIGSDPSQLDCPSTTTCYVTGLSFPPPPTSEAPQPHAVVEVTHDGGTTWQESPLPPGGVTIGSITCPGVNTCMLSGRTQGHGPAAGVMFRTTNGGESWVPLPLPDPPGGFVPLLSCATTLKCDSLRSVPGPDGLGVSYVSDVTSDGGRTWTSSPMPGTFRGYALECTTSNYCIAGGQRPSAYRITDPTRAVPAAALYSSDGGVTWHSGTLPKEPAAHSIISKLSCADHSHCTAISDTIGRRPSAHVLETTDGGKNWSPSPGASPSVLLDVLSCPTYSHCWASGFPLHGQQGVIYSTNDGGEHWTREQLPKDRGSALRLILDISCSTRFRCVALANPSTSLSGPQVVISFGLGRR